MMYFDELVTRKLNLTPRTDAELRHVLNGFEQKWQDKARHLTDKEGRALRS